MKPKVTIERARAVVRVGELMQELCNPNRIKSYEVNQSKARRAIRTLELARLALLDNVCELHIKASNYAQVERKYLRDRTFSAKRIVLFLTKVGVLKGSAESARRQYNRMIQREELTHPADNFALFAMDIAELTKETIGYESLEHALLNWFPLKAEAIRSAFG